jgi:carboxypeptidase family protein/TonB-dependent receptor-like protein
LNNGDSHPGESDPPWRELLHVDKFLGVRNFEGGEMFQLRSGAIVIAAIAVLFALPADLRAQQLAAVRVTVTDPKGGAVGGATVTLKSADTGVKRSAISGENGLAVISDVPPGKYDLTVEASSFATQTMNTTLQVGQIASLEVSLRLAGQTEKVEVSATVQGVEAEKAELSQVIETRKIDDLPISGREFIDFALLTPSVTVGRSTAIGAQSPFTETVLKLSFAGLRESHTTLLTQDGIDYTTSISGVQRVTPSQDWVREFRVVNSPFTADTGRSLGSIVNTVIKSGTNDLHGALYEYFRNDALDAKNLLSAPGFSALRFNQFGGDIGAPIVRDKLFFFTGYEGQRRAESPVYSSFILNSIQGINAVKEFFNLQPENLASILQTENYDKFIGKATANLNEKNFFMLTYVFNDVRKKNARGAAPGEGLPSSYRNNPVRDQTVYGNLVHIGSPNLTLDTSAQFGRRTFHLDPVGAGLEPAILIPDLFFGGGFVGSFRFYQEKRLQLIENFSYHRGNHSFKFGGEFHQIWSQTEDPLFSPAFAIFSPQSFFGAPPFTAPTALFYLFMEPRQFFGQQIPPRTLPFTSGLFAGPSQKAFEDGVSLDYNHHILGMYGQDSWKLTSKLTLNLGLRYEFESMPSAGQAKFVAPGGNHFTDYKDVQPRASFGYSFNQKRGVIRGGYGIFTAPFVFSDLLVSWIGGSEFTYMNQPLLPEFQDPQNRLIGLGASGAVGVIPSPPGPFGTCPTPNQAFTTFTSTGAYPPPFSPNPGPPCLAQFPAGYADRTFRRPSAQQASLEVEHQLVKDWVISAGYQYVHGVRLPIYLSINGLPNGQTVNGVPINCPPPVPGFPAGKPYFCPNIFSPGFGFALLATPRGFSIYHAGTLSVRKSFANHYSVLANYTWSKSIDIETTIDLPNSPEDFTHINRDRAVGDNHIPHRFTLALLGEMPDRGNPLIRDFKASIVTTAQSARRFTINAGFDTNGDNFAFPDRVGLIGRNTYGGDNLIDLDLRIQRGFHLGEKARAEGSVEFFNLLNQVNVEDVDHVYGLADFAGPVPQHFGDGIGSPANPSFGSPKFVGPARQIQLSLRILF